MREPADWFSGTPASASPITRGTQTGPAFPFRHLKGHTMKNSSNSKSTAVTKKKSAVLSRTKAVQKDLSDLFLHALKDIYYAEKKILKSLPKMIKAAQADELSDALENHRSETEQQISHLEQIFGLLGKPAKGEKCDAIDGILAEGDGILKDFGKTKAGDAAIIFSAQAVEHYEITRYGSMHAFAKVLGYNEAADLIEEILDQEKTADQTLSAMAEARIDYAAAEYDEAAGDVETEGMHAGMR
jgi:ferritin-like metal-binding protein YciE